GAAHTSSLNHPSRLTDRMLARDFHRPHQRPCRENDHGNSRAEQHWLRPLSRPRNVRSGQRERISSAHHSMSRFAASARSLCAKCTWLTNASCPTGSSESKPRDRPNCSSSKTHPPTSIKATEAPSARAERPNSVAAGARETERRAPTACPRGPLSVTGSALK